MNFIPLIDIARFSEFIRANYKPSRAWADIEGYVAWYIGNGYIIAINDEKNEVAAICAIRPVERPGLGVLPFYHNEHGACLHIDLLIDKTGSSLALFLFQQVFFARFGPREWVTMFRHHEEKLHVYPYHKFWKAWGRFRKSKRANIKDKQNGTATIATATSA
jgi:hypothetical protein